VTLRRVATGARVAVRPAADTIYRLTEGCVRGPEVGVSVSPRLRVRPRSPSMLSGAVLPRSTGAVTDGATGPAAGASSAARG